MDGSLPSASILSASASSSSAMSLSSRRETSSRAAFASSRHSAARRLKCELPSPILRKRSADCRVADSTHCEKQKIAEVLGVRSRCTADHLDESINFWSDVSRRSRLFSRPRSGLSLS